RRNTSTASHGQEGLRPIARTEKVTWRPLAGGDRARAAGTGSQTRPWRGCPAILTHGAFPPDMAQDRGRKPDVVLAGPPSAHYTFLDLHAKGSPANGR